MIPTLRSSLEHHGVPVPAAVVYPGGDVCPGVARHLLALDPQQYVLKHRHHHHWHGQRDSAGRFIERNLILHGRLESVPGGGWEIENGEVC